MKKSGILASVVALGIAVTAGAGAWGQDELPAPSPIEKELAARAEHVTEVTLDKNMLAFAAKFMKDDDDAEARAMVQNLKGVYVREYEFEKEKSYTAQELDGLRSYFKTADWSPMVYERSKNSAEATDVYVKLVNGQMEGLFVLDAEARELSIVLILGPIDVDKIGKLGGTFGIPKGVMKRAEKKGEGK
jgi:Domain of unknown function (DUF4252)